MKQITKAKNALKTIKKTKQPKEQQKTIFKEGDNVLITKPKKPDKEDWNSQMNHIDRTIVTLKKTSITSTGLGNRWFTEQWGGQWLFNENWMTKIEK